MNSYGGAIAGGVIGGIVFLAIVIYCIRRNMIEK